MRRVYFERTARVYLLLVDFFSHLLVTGEDLPLAHQLLLVCVLFLFWPALFLYISSPKQAVVVIKITSCMWLCPLSKVQCEIDMVFF